MIRDITDDPEEPDDSNAFAGLVGKIIIQDDGSPAIFKIINNDYEIESAGPNVRPCEHGGTFIMDEKWHTIICSLCREKLDPYAVVKYYAVWWNRFKTREALAEQAEHQLHVTRLRYLLNLKSVPDAERTEGNQVLRESYRHKAAALDKLVQRIENARRGR